jgi:hypothetical protein
MSRCTVFQILVLALGFAAHGAVAQTVKTPEEVYATRPHNLSILPPDAITGRPLQLEVSFNLRHAPNSPEAEAFLKRWHDTISALPDNVSLKLYRMVSPAKYAYMVSLGFRNWQEYRTYESSEAFLAYYRAHWKPNVTEAEERLSVLETPITPPDN